jgi:H+-transporting ATPase
VQAGHTAGHLGHLVIRLNNVLIAGALLLSVVNTGVSLARGRALAPVLEFTLLLLVAAIPASMPTVLSVMLAAGAQRIARKRALTTRIEAIEELACMDYLCADKTGTLTKNVLAAGQPWCLDDVPASRVMLDAALASSTFDRDAIDTAIYAAVPPEARLDDYTVLEFQPFDPLLKRTEALVADQSDGCFRMTKGAVQVILDLAKADSRLRERVEAVVSDFAGHGARALAIARARDGGPWQVEGVVPLFDPVRDDSASAVETVRSQGVRMLLLTGDQLPIGIEIARRVGLGTTILAPDTAGAGGMPTLPATVLAEVDGFAQVLPEHKFHIVEALQRERHVVGMVGDGVNDAPALRKADVGIAVSGAGDAVRSASDLVLLASGLTVIAEAITTSRQVYQRMHTYVVYRVSETMRRMLSMVLASLIFVVYPLTPIMLGLLATLNAGVLIALAYDRVETPKNPTRWQTPALLTVAVALGLLGIFEFFGLLYISAVLFQLPHVASQTVLYLGLSLAGHLTIFVTRTRGPFWSLSPAPILLSSVVIAEAVATAFAVFGIFMAPISWELAAVVWAWCVTWFFVEDRVKLGAYALVDRFGQRQDPPER